MPSRDEQQERNDAMCAEYAKGKSMDELARMHDLHPRYVRKLMRERGLLTTPIRKIELKRDAGFNGTRVLANAIGRWR
jgi:hypothetical protein